LNRTGVNTRTHLACEYVRNLLFIQKAYFTGGRLHHGNTVAQGSSFNGRPVKRSCGCDDNDIDLYCTIC